MYLGTGRDEIQHDPLRLPGVRRSQHADSVCLEGGNGPLNAVVVRYGREPTTECSIEVWMEFAAHRCPLLPSRYICACKHTTAGYLQMQVDPRLDDSGVSDPAMANKLPGGR